MLLQDLLADAFPIDTERRSLHLVDAHQRAHDGALVLTVRLLIWELTGGTRTIRDIKEQEIHIGLAEHLSDPRLPACVAGWVQAIRQIFDQQDPRLEALLDATMPEDLLPTFADLLALRRPQTPQDFADALLTSKKRLARYLITP
ncbi:MAG: hypothetical protein IPK80_01510 [Nannocystis sp.]|nr:hypothetical protein [Nannocystis sp.]